jgi:hypothetical protein
MKTGLKDTPLGPSRLTDKRRAFAKLQPPVIALPAPVAQPAAEPVELDVVPSLLERNGYHAPEPAFDIRRLARLLGRVMPRAHQQTLRAGLLAWARNESHQSGDRSMASRLADALGRRL